MSPKQPVTLVHVNVNDVLYPLSVVERKKLEEAGYTPAHIPNQCFTALKTTVFRGMKFKVLAWEDARMSLLDHVRTLMEAEPALAGIKFDFHHDRGSWMFFVPTDNPEDFNSLLANIAAVGLSESRKLVDKAKEDEAASARARSRVSSVVENYLMRLRRYLGQYQHSLRVEHRVKPEHGGMVFRLSIEFAPNLPNHIFFEPDGVAPDIACLMFGMSFRIAMELHTDLSGKKSIVVRQEDRTLDTWLRASNRSFDTSMVDRKSVIDTINFLTNLL